MKRKLILPHPLRRLAPKQLLALLLSLTLVLTCTIVAVIGYTFASGGARLQGQSLGSASFGGGTARAYLEENPAAAAADMDDNLKLILEAERPAGSGGEEPTTEPEGNPTTEPEDNPTTEPEGSQTTEPEGNQTTEPEDNQTTEPEDSQTTEPEGSQTTEPEGNQTTEPEGNQTTEPEGNPTTEPEGETTTSPGVGPLSEPDGSEAIVMNDIGFYTELADHIRNYFTVTGIEIAVRGSAGENWSYTYDNSPLAANGTLSLTAGAPAGAPDVTVTKTADDQGRDWQYDIRLHGAFDAGMRLEVAVLLAFDREAYNAAPILPGVMMNMLDSVEAYCADVGNSPVAFVSPQIAYPAVGEAGEGLVAEMNASFTRAGVPMTGSYVREGDVIAYEIEITNDSEEDITALQVEAPIPAGTTFDECLDAELTADSDEDCLYWEIPLLQIGETVVLRFTVSVDSLPLGMPSRSIDCHALVANYRVDAEAFEQYAGEITSSIIVSPVNGETVEAGDVITYTYEVINVGGEDLEDIEVVFDSITGDVKEAAGCTPVGGNISGAIGAWVIDLLNPGEKATLQYAVEVEPLAAGVDLQEYLAVTLIRTADGDYTHTETFKHYQFAENLQLRTLLRAEPDGGNVYAGKQIIYYIDVTNSSTTALSNIPVSCLIPAGTALVPGSANPVPDNDSPQVEWVIASIAPDETVTLEFAVLVQALSGNTGRTIAAAAVVNGADTNTVNHTQNAVQLAFEKKGDVAGESVAEDDVITYTISVTNEGNDPAYGVEIQDALPENLDYVIGSATASNPTNPTAAGTPVELLPVSVPSRTITCEVTGSGATAEGVDRYNFRWAINELLPDETAEVSFQARVTALPASLGGRSFDNTAYVNGEETETVSYRQQGKGLDIEKSANPAGGLVRTDDTILYTVRVENLGTDPEYDVVILDDLPEGTEFDDTFAPAVVVDGDALGEMPLLPADEAGKEGLFTWNETDGLVRFVIGALQGGSEAEATFRVKVLAPGANDQSSTRDIANTAKVQGKDTNAVTHIQALQDIAVIKSALPADGGTVYARKADGSGTRITYYIEVTNASGAAKADVEITDAIPAGLVYVPGSMTIEKGIQGEVNTVAAGTTLRWVVESIAPDDTVTVEFQADVSEMPVNATSGRSFVNSAQAGGFLSNSVTHNQELESVAGSSFTAVKSAVPLAGNVEAGSVITYTIEVENTGTEDEIDLPVFDAIPAGTEYVKDSAKLTIGSQSGNDVTYDVDGESLAWVIPKLAPDEKAVIEFQVTVLDEGTTSRTIRNKAQVGAGSAARDTNEVVHTLNRGASSALISAKKSAEATAPVSLGDTIQYFITVKNEGGTAAPLTAVYDEIPAGTVIDETSILGGGTLNVALSRVEWSVTNLAPGAAVTLGFTVKVTTAKAGTIRNTAMVDGEETNEVTHTVIPPALFAEKSADRPDTDVLEPGDTLTYTITVSNNTDAAMKKVPVLDVIPKGTAYVADSADNNGVYSKENGNVQWAIDIEPQTQKELKFKVRVGEIESGEVSIKNQALYGEAGDTTPDIFTNQVAHTAKADNLPLVPVSDVTVTKTADISQGQIPGGQRLTYALLVENKGSAEVKGIKVRDKLPTGVSAPIDFKGSYDAVTRELTWTIDSMKAGAKEALTFIVTANANLGTSPVTITNKAYYVPGTGFAEIETNAVTHTVAPSGTLNPLPTGGINIGSINISIGNGSGNGNNINSGNNSNNNKDKDDTSKASTTKNSSSSNKSGTTSAGGKGIPKTSEASALWAILLVLGSGSVATVAIVILLRKKKALARTR